MEFRVLGPLEAGGERASLALGPRKQRALLARLLLDADRTVSVERLLDDLWGEDLPDTAVKMIQIYVSGLRKVVGSDRLVTQPPGYRFALGPDDVLDLRRFERLAAAAGVTLAEGDPVTARAQLREALALWRGPALAEFAAEPFARGENARLEDLRVAAIERRIDADLALGDARALIGELEALVGQHPLRERLREQLMLALYRSGRQGEALAAYHDFRAELDRQLGLEPSPQLRALEHAILTHDAGLDARAPVRILTPLGADAPPGRAAELEALFATLDAARGGSRRLVLVAGEPGIGKSTLVEALLAAAADTTVIRGHCLEQETAGEPYLPLLDGLGRAAEDPGVAAVLAARAPSWLAQLPWIGAEPPQEHAVGTTRERMLREIVAAVDALAAVRPVILALEDLQWADPSTRDVLAALMRRRHPARVLVLATATGHDPLVGELSLRAAAQELVVSPLDANAAAAAFGVERDVADELVLRGGGNPLFMRHLLEHLKETGSLGGVPASLRAALHARLGERGAGELEVLQAAAVEGTRFTAAAVAAAIDQGVDAIVAPSIVVPGGTVDWPDGTHTAAYTFVHGLYREVLLEMIPAARRAELHRRIGERLEAAFGAAPETAPAIARHYVAGRRPAPAVRFLQLCAGQCVARRAHHEAVEHLEQALAAADDLPGGPLRLRLETELLSELGQAHVAVGGWSSPAAVSYLEQARETAEALGDQEPLAAVLLALGTLYEIRGNPEAALAAMAAGPGGDHGVAGAELLACAMFHQGAFTRALEHADRGVGTFEAGEDAGHYDSFPATFGDNAGVACHDWAALSLWFLGRADESLRRARKALELSEAPTRLYSTATACAQMAALHACRGEPEPTRYWAQATVDAGRDRGYAYRVAMGRVLRGWADAAEGRADGVHELARGLRASRETGARLEDPFYLGLLADAHLRAGEPQAGLAAVEEALAIAARERSNYYDAELHRLRGELLLAAGQPLAEAEAAIRDALAISREQGARSLELRAALALARALPDARAGEARALVAGAHESLADEDTPEVRAAAALLSGATNPPVPAFERRRISVLAWEIDGIAGLAQGLDPEQLGAVVNACRQAAQATTAGEAGHVAVEHESGGLVYFGYPRALEDGAVRAVRAARALTQAPVVTGNGKPVRLSAGVDSGAAVIGPLDTRTLAMGPTPRAARRLAVDAPAGGVLISDATRSLCAWYFSFASTGAGHEVTGETGARSRLDARAGELSPLVGRDRELGLLAGRWEQATHGLGQAVFLAGEAGIGKSRLVRELVATVDPDDGMILEFQCSDAHESTALHPLAEHFRRRLADESGGVEALVADAGLPVADAAPVIAALLGLPDAAHLEPDALRRRTIDVAIGYVLAHAERRSVIAVVEDLHWADPSTLELVEELLDAVADARVLVVATFRPTLGLPWEPHSHVTQLSLGPCTPSEAEQLIAHVAPVPLPAAVARTIIERGDGIPLFIEELARSAATGGEGIPTTLHDSLMSRLDALGPAAKAIAQLAALIGREFSRDLLASASELPPRALDDGLEQLLTAELIRRRGRTRPASFAFRHALLREDISASLADATRQSLHLRIAAALERADIVHTEPDAVARHLEAAGEPGRAVSYRFEAGRLALARSANAEAVDQLTRALADLEGYPASDGSADLELDLRILLGNALISIRGYASLEVMDCYGQARELCRRTDDDGRLLPVLYGLWVNAFVRAQHTRALELGLELCELAERRDPGVLMVAERTVGWPLICMGRFAEAREHLERIPALQQATDERPLRFLYGQDPAVAGLATGAWALWGCDEEEAAAARSEAAIDLARATEHPLTITYALGAGALLAACRRDARTARMRAVEALAVTDEFRFALWHAWALIALGNAQLLEGDHERAAATVRGALAGARATGAKLYEPFALTTLAEAEAGAGNADEALRCANAADAAALATGERFWLPHTRAVQETLTARRS